MLKVLPNLSNIEQRESVFNRLKGSFGDKYNKFFLYYEKNWLKSEFMDFNYDEEKKIRRTNNACEGMHSGLNRHIGINKPKMSILIDGLKELIKEKYNKYIKSSYQIENEEEPGIEVSNIYNHFHKFTLKSEVFINDFFNDEKFAENTMELLTITKKFLVENFGIKKITNEFSEDVMNEIFLPDYDDDSEIEKENENVDGNNDNDDEKVEDSDDENNDEYIYIYSDNEVRLFNVESMVEANCISDYDPDFVEQFYQSVDKRKKIFKKK